MANAHVDALEYLKRGGKSVFLNLGTGKGYTVKEIAEKVKLLTGSNFKIEFEPRRKGDIAVSVASSVLAKELLGWECLLQLEDIVKTAWEWEKKTT